MYKLDEGITPIFDRDEIIHWLPDVPEQRVIAMVGDTPVERNLKPEPVLRRRVNRSTSRERRKSGTARSRSPAQIHAEGTKRHASYIVSGVKVDNPPKVGVGIFMLLELELYNC